MNAWKAVTFGVLLLSAASSPCAANDSESCPIEVRSVKDLLAFAKKERLAGADLFADSVGYLLAYVDGDFDPSASAAQKDSLLLSLVNKRTPDQVILVGHLLRLERVRRAAAEDGRMQQRKGGNDGPSSEYSENETYLKRVIMQYTVELSKAE